MTRFFSNLIISLIIKGIFTFIFFYIAYFVIFNVLAHSGALQVIPAMGIELNINDVMFNPVKTIQTIIEAQMDQLLNIGF